MAKNPNAIRMVRGDTYEAKVHIFDDVNGHIEEYIPKEGDTVRFALKHQDMERDGGNYKDKEPLLKKDIPISTMHLKLDPEDTESFKFGTYDYDIELTFNDGDRYTFIEAAPFIIAKEVD